MPHEPLSITLGDGTRIDRWSYIEQLLHRPLYCAKDLEDMLALINAGRPVDTSGLRGFLSEHCTSDECQVRAVVLSALRLNHPFITHSGHFRAGNPAYLCTSPPAPVPCTTEAPISDTACGQ